MATLARSEEKQRGGLIVLPHPNDKILALAYFKMEREKIELPDGPPMSTLEVVYYQGVPSLMGFLQFHLASENTTFACFEPSLTSDVADLRGLGWINMVASMGKRKKAEVGFTFFDCPNIGTKLRFGRKMIDETFGRLPIDVLFGTTPSPNIRALAYARRLGFTLHGPIPDYATWRGGLIDVWVSRLNKESWEGSK